MKALSCVIKWNVLSGRLKDLLSGIEGFYLITTCYGTLK